MVAKAETLIDNFNDNSIDTNKWSVFGGGSQVAETNNELEITTLTTVNFYGIESVNKFDLTSSYALVKLITPGDTSILFHVTQLYIQLDTSNQLKWTIDSTTIKAEKNVGGSNSQVGSSTTYDPAIHKWLRIRESGGTIYWDYSTDEITWTNFTSLANPFIITSINLDISAGVYSPTSSGTTSKFDDFNIVYNSVSWFGM